MGGPNQSRVSNTPHPILMGWVETTDYAKKGDFMEPAQWKTPQIAVNSRPSGVGSQSRGGEQKDCQKRCRNAEGPGLYGCWLLLACCCP